MGWLRETKSWLWLAAAVCLLVIAIFVLGRCSQRDAINEARQNETKAEARTESAVDAIEKINDLGERSNATDAEVEQAANAIRQADPADRDRVFRYRVCLLQHRTDCDGLL